MTDVRWWLVSYDVHDPKRLRKCAKHVEGYGLRVQYSVPVLADGAGGGAAVVGADGAAGPGRLGAADPAVRGVRGGIVGIHGTERSAEWTDRPPRHTGV